MEAPGDHPFVVIVRALARSLAAELHRSFVRLTTTLIALIACAAVVITAVIAAVVVGIIHIGRGLLALAETMIGQSWQAEVAVGTLLIFVPLLIAALSLRRSKYAGNDGS